MGMLSLASYFDASGDDNREAPLVVAGLLSTEAKWRRFERKWEEMLSEFGGVPYLHMKELNSFPYREPYDVWGDNKDKRGEFLAKAVGIIHQNVNKIITLYLHVADFNDVNKRYNLERLYKGPFCFTASACIGRMKGWKQGQHKYSSCPIKYFYEAGDLGSGCVREFSKHGGGIDALPLPAQDPETKKWFAPFQAGDFIAYEVATEWSRSGVDVRELPIRKSLSAIIRQLQPQILRYPKEALEELARTWPEAFPPR
jgi:hypothetical protein